MCACSSVQCSMNLRVNKTHVYYMALETRREDLSGAWDCWGDEQERMLKERMDPQLGIVDRVRSRIKPLK